MPYANKKDEDLARDLAKQLNDFEFEMLMRERIRMKFDEQMILNQNLDESHNYCNFQFSWNDKSIWEISLGGSYKDRVSLSGEVLGITLVDCHEMWQRRNRNKLSFLLPE